MCRNIKTLFNFDPPATDDEVRAACLQFVRKLSGFNKPSKANAAAFERAVEEASQVANALLDSLTTTAPPRDRDVEAARARERVARRFGPAAGSAPLSPAYSSSLGEAWCTATSVMRLPDTESTSNE
jgi:hypothetical protein